VNCPACAMPGSSVSKTIVDKTVTRRRSCEDCGAYWTTDERVRKGTISVATTRPSLATNVPVSLDPKSPGDHGTENTQEKRPAQIATAKAPNSDPPKPKYSELFEECWKLYGRKEEKDEAFSQWRAQTKLVGTERGLRDLVVAALAWQADIWAVDGWKFAVYFHRYLKRKKYRDERPSAAKAPRPVDDIGRRAVDAKVAALRATPELTPEQRAEIRQLAEKKAAAL
jgi:hypothetical protein